MVGGFELIQMEMNDSESIICDTSSVSVTFVRYRLVVKRHVDTFRVLIAFCQNFCLVLKLLLGFFHFIAGEVFT